MTPNDVIRAVFWSAINGFRIDLLFNARAATRSSPSDKLTQALVRYKNQFNWVNHTYSGEPNNDTSYDWLVNDIQQNISWARANAGSASTRPERAVRSALGLQQPEHAGGDREDRRQVGRRRQLAVPTAAAWGTARACPRYPSNIYYNAATKAQMLDEYNYLYLPPSSGGKCQNSATTTCFSKAATWSEYVDREASTMLRHVLGNDPRPHYVHQANLAGDGTLYASS